MRGTPERQRSMLVHLDMETQVPADHPLRKIKALVDEGLARLSPRFAAAYAALGRPSIPPEHLLKALLLQTLYSIRSERQLVDQLNWNLLFRWFLDLEADAAIWDATTFTKNRDRFAAHGLVQAFFDGVVKQAVEAKLVSSDHFTVDATLIQALASLKSLVPREGPGPDRDDDPGNPSVNFRGEKRINQTHWSKTDPEAKLMRKGDGRETKLCHGASVLMENRHGLVVAVAVHEPFPSGEKAAVPGMVRHVRRRFGLRVRTTGADAGYADGKVLRAWERLGIVPHVAKVKPPADPAAPNAAARARAVRRQHTLGYTISQRIRKEIEEVFGWGKTIGGMARTRFVGRWRVALQVLLIGSAYNLIRMAKCVT